MYPFLPKIRAGDFGLFPRRTPEGPWLRDLDESTRYSAKPCGSSRTPGSRGYYTCRELRLSLGLFAILFNAIDITHGFGVRRNAAVFVDSAGAGIVRGQRVPQAAIVFLQQIAQVACAGIGVLRGVGGIGSPGFARCQA